LQRKKAGALPGSEKQMTFSLVAMETGLDNTFNPNIAS
jgi:hypothetical protein